MENINDFNINKFQEYIDNKDYKTAVEYAKVYTEKENFDAILAYGSILYRGIGIEKNIKEAYQYFDKITENDTNIDNMIKLVNYLVNNYPYYDKAIGYYFGKIMDNATKEEKDKLFNTLNENTYLATHNWHIYVDFASRIERGYFINQDKYEAARYYKMTIDKKYDTDKAMKKYANIIENNKKVDENTEEEISIYKQLIREKWDTTGAMVAYAEMLYEGEGIEKNEEEAIKLYKEIIDKGNCGIFRLNGDINLIRELLKYTNGKDLKNENIVYNDEQKKDRIKEFKNVNFDETQSRNQVKVDKEFYYDENCELCEIVDKAYHKDSGNLLYEIKYKNNNEREIIYHLGDEIDIIANIDGNGIIKFDFNNINITPEELREKTYKILNSFNENDTKNMRGFSVPLSYLAYAPLQLQIKDEVYNNKIIFDIYSGKDINNFLDVVNNSFEDENKDKTYICHFLKDGHYVQMMICNGDAVVFNTGGNGMESYGSAIEEIKTKFAKKMEQNKTPERKINISQYKTLGQRVNNCAVAPIFAMSNFIIEKSRVNKVEINSIPKNLNDFIEKETKYKNESEILENLKEEHIEIMKIELVSQILNYENNKKAFLTLHKDFEETIDKLYNKVKEKDKNNNYNIDSINESDKKIEKTEKKRLENTFNKLLMVESFFKDHVKEKNSEEVNIL